MPLLPYSTCIRISIRTNYLAASAVLLCLHVSTPPAAVGAVRQTAGWGGGPEWPGGCCQAYRVQSTSLSNDLPRPSRGRVSGGSPCFGFSHPLQIRNWPGAGPQNEVLRGDPGCREHSFASFDRRRLKPPHLIVLPPCAAVRCPLRGDPKRGDQDKITQTTTFKSLHLNIN